MHKNIFLLSVLTILSIFFLSGSVFAADKIKTSEFLVYSSASQVSSSVNAPFSIYIGDDLSGITGPVKSVYFIISGVYTSGGGTIQAMLDSDTATSKTFTLSAAATPKYFELLYKDPSNKINPTSAGTYNYTFNFIPTGMTISGLGIKAISTHRHITPTCSDGTTDKVKTTEFLVASSVGQISSASNNAFSIYIGDELSGITNPVKSVYFVISGVYTSGGGTIQAMLDSDTATSKTFTLSAAATPKYFELLYKDPSNKINPTSAGTYNYTFNLTPSGVTISGLGIKAVVSHKYRPPTCGSGYPIKGNLISNIFETSGSTGVAYNSILWKGTLGGPSQDQGKVRFQMATSDNTAGPWNFVGGSTCGSSDWFTPSAANTPAEIGCYSELNNKRYYKYKIEICSNDCISVGTYTPTVTGVVVNWSP